MLVLLTEAHLRFLLRECRLLRELRLSVIEGVQDPGCVIIATTFLLMLAGRRSFLRQHA